MSHEIKIPSIGESITSATISKWHKSDGDYVESGEVILTIDTDKISTELESTKSGILKCVAKEGEDIGIGEVVAKIEEGKLDESKSNESILTKETEKGYDELKSSDKKTKITPVAKKIANENNIDISLISGTGAGNKIVKNDVLESFKDNSNSQKTNKSTINVESSLNKEDRFTKKKMSPMRKKIGEHLLNAQKQAAILSTFNECDMSNVIALRKKFQDTFIKKHDVKLGFMSFFIKSVVKALKEVPSINARIEDDYIIENNFYDIGVAVGTEKGLVVPVIKDCDKKEFFEIEKELIEYANKARNGSISIQDLQGGSFTITNGGIYGSLLSTPILNSPQSGILGMHSIKERPIAESGSVVIRPMMYLTLSYDHRLVDGKEAVDFLVKIKDSIENPEIMLLGI